MADLPTESDPVRIIQADCLDVLPELAGVVSAVITDPPYGIALSSHGSRFRGMKAIAGDESTEVGQAAIDFAQSRGWPVLAFADPELPWSGEWRQRLVWNKGEAVGIGGDRKTCWKFTWELIQVGRFPAVYGGRDGAVLDYRINSAHYAHHPAEKPVRLMRYLVRKLTQPGALVLDPFAGSGTTGVACAIEGRRCLLIEREPAYVAIARRRIDEALGRTGLFASLAAQATGGASGPAPPPGECR